MKLIGKVPVEPLDDERLTNIERKLVVAVSDMRAPAPHASRRALAFAGIAMAIALAGFAGWKLHKAPVVEEKAQTFAMKSSTERSLLDLGDAQLASAPGTDVRVERRLAKTLVMMERGELSLTVEHNPGRLLVVRAGDTEIEDVGTKFSVLFDGKSHVEVRVTEGEVKVHRAGKDFAVTAANAWTTELGTTTIAQLDAAAVDVVAQDVVPGDVGGAMDHIDTSATDNRGAQVGSASDNRGSDNRGSAVDNRGSGSGSGATKKPRTPVIVKAILAVPLNPLPGTMNDYLELLKTTNGDKSRITYSMAVAYHLAKNDDSALYSIKGTLNHRTTDEAYKDAMWLQVRVRCLKALDDQCRIVVHRYLNEVDAGNIPYGQAAGVAQAILKEIAL